MLEQPAAMHVARIKSSHTDRQGRRRGYESRLLRRTYREDGQVRHETLANLSKLPGHMRDLALALVISRVAHPGLEAVHPGVVGRYHARPRPRHRRRDCRRRVRGVDWLRARHDAIEKSLARRHLAPAVSPQRMALFDLSSSRLEGSHGPPGTRGYSRDGKKGKVQIEYGLLTDPEGRPVAVRVFEGSTADPAAFAAIADVVHETFGLRKMVMAGDRGMITSARIEALRELHGKYAWITALRSPAIRKLMAGDGPLQLSLFDERDLAEITSPDFPGERLVACRNPALAGERARKREALLAVTEKLLAPVAARVAAGRLSGADKIGTAVGKVIGTYKMAEHLDVTITDTSLAGERRQDQIHDEARLDRIYVIRTPSPPPKSASRATC